MSGQDPAEAIIDEYFEYLADRDVYRAPTVLSWMTDYIDTHNEAAVFKLLQHTLALEALAGLVDLLEFDDLRLTESVVHILGTIVEHARCRQYVLDIPRNSASKGDTNPTLFTALVNMLMSEDKNVVMNAAGTLANISESADGRLWILQQAAFDDALPILGLLTVDTHQWAASNSALVLARLTLSPEGVVKILSHDRSSYILTNLCISLSGANPGSSMNSAFAIGRLLERDDARGKLLGMKNFKNAMTALTKMLYNKEAGPRKNSCFAFSCLANSKEGHSRLLENVNSELILDQLTRLLTDVDDETAWFAAVTLRSICSQKEGVFRLRDHKTVHGVLKKLVKSDSVKIQGDLMAEVKLTLDIIGKLPKLPAPTVQAKGCDIVSAKWEPALAASGSKIVYQLYQGSTCVYEGRQTNCEVKRLKAYTSYVFRIRTMSGDDEGPYSGPTIVTTLEGVPGAPSEVYNEGKAMSNNIKISWNAPSKPNGTITGYKIYTSGECVGVVGADKLSFSVRNLPHSTVTPVQIAAITSAGEGALSAPINCSTLNLRDYPPRKPILSTSGGCNEINVSWIDPPKQLGVIANYELVMNGEVIYSGKEQSYRVSNLEPLAEYTFAIRVITQDGYIVESEIAKKRAGAKVMKRDSGTTEEKLGDDPRPLEDRTPTPEIAKPPSDTDREIIRPVKKKYGSAISPRNPTNTSKSPNKAVKPSTKAPEPNEVTHYERARYLSTIEEMSNTPQSTPQISVSSPPNTAQSVSPSGVTNVIVTRTKLESESESSSQSLEGVVEEDSRDEAKNNLLKLLKKENSQVRTDVVNELSNSCEKGPVDVLANSTLKFKPCLEGNTNEITVVDDDFVIKKETEQQFYEEVPPENQSKIGIGLSNDERRISFDKEVRLNTSGILSEKSDPDTTTVYMQNIVKASIPAYDPAIETSATKISIENDNHGETVEFLVDYVTEYSTDLTSQEYNSTNPTLNANHSEKLRTESSIINDVAHANQPQADSTVVPHNPQNTPQNNSDDHDSSPQTSLSRQGSLVELRDKDVIKEAGAMSGARELTQQAKDKLNELAKSEGDPGIKHVFQETDNGFLLVPENATFDISQSLSRANSGSKITSLDRLEKKSEVLRILDRDRTSMMEGDIRALSEIELIEKSDRPEENMPRKKSGKKPNPFERGTKDSEKFSMSKMKRPHSNVDEQKKIIDALLSGQNDELNAQNQRTRDIMQTVRRNIQNSIRSKDAASSKRSTFTKQVSTFRDLVSTVHQKQPPQLHTMDMTQMFGDFPQPQQQRKPIPQANSSQQQSKKKRKKREHKLPPLDQSMIKNSRWSRLPP